MDKQEQEKGFIPNELKTPLRVALMTTAGVALIGGLVTSIENVTNEQIGSLPIGDPLTPITFLLIGAGLLAVNHSIQKQLKNK